MAKYEFTDEAVKQPRWTVLGNVRVAMGSPITIPATPPDLPIEIPVADQDQMARLYDLGYKSLIRKSETKKAKKAEDESE